MATDPWFNENGQRLAIQTRERFVAGACRMLDQIGDGVLQHLRALLEQPGSARDAQERRDAWMTFQEKRAPWLAATAQAWHGANRASPEASTARSIENGLELIGMEVMESRLLASRMALAVLENIRPQFDDLRVRIEHLQGRELAARDVLQPEALLLALIEQWSAVGLPRGALQTVADLLQKILAQNLLLVVRECNEWLIAQNVLPRIELQQRVRRSPPTGRTSTGSPALSTDHAESKKMPGDAAAGRAGGSGPRSGSAAAALSAGADVPASSGQTARALDETRMMTGTTPLARARMRAQGVFGHLKRLLVNQVGDLEKTARQPPTPALAEAIRVAATSTARSGVSIATAGAFSTTLKAEAYSPAGMARVAGALREQTADLKKKAGTDSERATIEVVALMFQSILAEERIPPAIRVWFARLQLPVLRVALAEPQFFGTISHPARLLIDRMGSCVMGFDAQAINGSALETEVKRVVQVIEQYPETGGRVFQLVHDEFQKFLARYLTEKGATQQVVSVAQQIEQKETLVIQYTIEMRNLLKDMAIPAAIREFLFKVWAEVLALAAIRHGPQHAETLALKRVAPELVWSASAKPNRADRARVIQELPQLLQRLRRGMTLLGLSAEVQEGHVKAVSDALAAAFLSKSAPIAPAQIEAMARRLANLEDFATDEATGDLPLDAESLLPMLGIDASTLEIVSAGGSRPNEAMIAWALELQTGHWFTLEHNGALQQVQFVWRSQRKQLFLFTAPSGTSYLLQRRRLAAYLQAGLLLPQEEEALTVRATRMAIAKLDANPERLLH